MNFQESTEFLNALTNYERTQEYSYPEAFKLDRMRQLVRDLGHPQNRFESILIAGSKGKGSTAAYLSSILRMENYRVGFYSSPHLQDIRERIRVNGILIGPNHFAQCVSNIKKISETAAWRKEKPTYFECLTAVAFMYFHESKVDVAVLEVGLGGLYDSTNVAVSKCVGITPIGLEHTDKLGKTLQKIATQKAGVIKGREAVVVAPQNREVLEVLQKRAQDYEAKLYRVGQDITYQEKSIGPTRQTFDVKTPWGSYYDLETELLGAHQISNACVALGLAKAFASKTRFSVSESAIRQGIATTYWPGRLEQVSEHPRVLLDGAHTLESFESCLLAVERHFDPHHLTVLFAVAEDKDARGMLGLLKNRNHSLILTQFVHPRAKGLRELSGVADDLGLEYSAESDVVKALEMCKMKAGQEGLVLVCGSLYLVAEAQKLYRNLL